MKKETTGHIIKSARINKSLSQQDLADKLNVTRQAISNWENNISYPDQSIIVKLCRILEIEPRTIYDDIITNDIELFIKKDEQKQINYNIINLILIILILTGIIFLVTRKTFEFYLIDIDSEYFDLKNSYLLYSNKENYFNVGEIESKIFSLENSKIIIYYEEEANNINIYNGKYNDNIVIKLKNNKSIIKNIDKLYLEIHYQYRDESYHEHFKLNLVKTFDKDGIKEINVENTKDINNNYKLKIDTLINNGYKYNDSTKVYYKEDYKEEWYTYRYDIENNIFTLSTGINEDIIYANKYYNDNYIKIGYYNNTQKDTYVTIYYNDSIIKFNEEKEFEYIKYLNALNNELAKLESN